MEQKSTGPYVIVLDDDPMIPRIVEQITGVTVLHFSSRQALQSRAQRYAPLAALIDIHLDENECGLDVVPALRSMWPETPILVITGDLSDDAIGRALAVGANDFVRKPIHPEELKARLKARLTELSERQNKSQTPVGDVIYDRDLGMVTGRGRNYYLSPMAKNLFECLLNAKGMVVSRKELKRKVWGDIRISDNALDKKTSEVRSVLSELSDFVRITSLYGVGLHLECDKPGN